jgi:hypothetical protein
VFRTVTSAAGTTEFDASVTVPVIVADPANWLNAALGNPTAKANANTQVKRLKLDPDILSPCF